MAAITQTQTPMPTHDHDQKGEGQGEGPESSSPSPAPRNRLSVMRVAMSSQRLVQALRRYLTPLHAHQRAPTALAPVVVATVLHGFARMLRPWYHLARRAAAAAAVKHLDINEAGRADLRHTADVKADSVALLRWVMRAYAQLQAYLQRAKAAESLPAAKLACSMSADEAAAAMREALAAAAAETAGEGGGEGEGEGAATKTPRRRRGCPATARLPMAAREDRAFPVHLAWRLPRRGDESPSQQRAADVHPHLLRFVLLRSRRPLLPSRVRRARFLYWATFRGYLQYRVLNTLGSERGFRESPALARLAFDLAYTTLPDVHPQLHAIGEALNALAGSSRTGSRSTSTLSTPPSASLVDATVVRDVRAQLEDALANRSFADAAGSLHASATAQYSADLSRPDARPLPAALRERGATRGLVARYLGAAAVLAAGRAVRVHDEGWAMVNRFVRRLLKSAMLPKSALLAEARARRHARCAFHPAYRALCPLLSPPETGAVQASHLVAQLRAAYHLDQGERLAALLLRVLVSQCDRCIDDEVIGRRRPPRACTGMDGAGSWNGTGRYLTLYMPPYEGGRADPTAGGSCEVPFDVIDVATTLAMAHTEDDDNDDGIADLGTQWHDAWELDRGGAPPPPP
jgi:hypothetical protein